MKRHYGILLGCLLCLFASTTANARSTLHDLSAKEAAESEPSDAEECERRAGSGNSPHSFTRLMGPSMISDRITSRMGFTPMTLTEQRLRRGLGRCAGLRAAGDRRCRAALDRRAPEV